jgi:ribonuclease Z
VSSRELVILGTASQVPTRQRNHNGYVLRWDDEVILFDPGEGTQRQMTLAGVSPASITAICITHFHGDHCLGLPGVLARFALDQLERPVDLYFPASGLEYLDRLRKAAIFTDWPHLRTHPIDEERVRFDRAGAALVGARLRHRVEAIGWRVEEADGRRMLPERLTAAGVRGPDVGRLQRDGTIEIDGTRVSLEEMSEARRGQRFAFIMDTGRCQAAVELARGADLVVCEATFLESEAELAERYGHLTAGQAAGIAAEAGARQLVLSHFSQRYQDGDETFLAEAHRFFADVVIARDLLTVPVPRLPSP